METLFGLRQQLWNFTCDGMVNVGLFDTSVQSQGRPQGHLFPQSAHGLRRWQPGLRSSLFFSFLFFSFSPLFSFSLHFSFFFALNIEGEIEAEAFSMLFNVLFVIFHEKHFPSTSNEHNLVELTLALHT